MRYNKSDVSLCPCGHYGDTCIYELKSPGLANRYYLLSDPASRPLLAFPEVIGLDCYRALIPPTKAALSLLRERGMGEDMDILTILRGGLNYPIEEACYECGIRVGDMHFLSCERKIENKVITGLEIKYEKVRAKKDRVMAIGDIFATGDTFDRCFDQFLPRINSRGGSLRRLLFFTIGGTRALPLMEAMTAKIKALWPTFEGVDFFFYEGMFTVYEDKGVSGINTPCIDFGWKDGVVTPEFRSYVTEHPDALLEKCIIYDGGARRYEIPIHFEEVLEYWEGILARADRIDPVALVAEKLGYEGTPAYEQWLKETRLEGCGDLRALWQAERGLIDLSGKLSLREVALRRIASIEEKQKPYIQ